MTFADYYNIDRRDGSGGWRTLLYSRWSTACRLLRARRVRDGKEEPMTWPSGNQWPQELPPAVFYDRLVGFGPNRPFFWSHMVRDGLVCC